LGNGDGTFRLAPQPEVEVQRGPISVAIGDFDGDDIPDLAVTNWGTFNIPGNTVSIRLGNGDGTFKPAPKQEVVVGPQPESVRIGDFNGDGIPDLAVANWRSNTVTILLGNGDGTFEESATIDVGLGPVSIAVEDFDRDGKQDLAVANF